MTTIYEVGPAKAERLNPTAPPARHTVVAWWLLTGPWHPIWSQFSLTVCGLEDREGVKPASLHFPGATHELLVLALPPERYWSAGELEKAGLGEAGYLEPVDVVHQFTATDAEMSEVAELAARGCVQGLLTPSTDDAREKLREIWLASCVRTLAHIRGEEHAP